MSRNTVLWTLVVFFGASVMFGYIRKATEDSLAAQIVAGLLLVAVIVLYIRRRG